MTRVTADQIRPCAKTVYLSPSGRRCRCVDSGGPTGRQITSYATFIYDLPGGIPGSSVAGDGFTLAQANWHLLRRVE